MTLARDSFVEDNPQQVIDAFKDCGWEAVLDGIADKGYAYMFDAFREAAVKAEEEAGKAHGKVLMLMAEACSMMLRPDKLNQPFDGRPSIIPDDFTDSEVKFIAEITESIDSPLLKGRLADLVWHRRLPRDPNFALTAIDSYIQLPLDVDTWFGDGEQCWQRAIGLVRMVGSTAGDRLGQIESSMVDAIQSATTKDKFLAYRLVDTLKSNGLGRNDSAAVAKKLEALAGEFGTEGDFHASESCYNAAAGWYADSGDNDKSIDMIVAEAEAFVGDATSRVSPGNPSYGVAASFLEDAIQVYRKVPRAHRDRHQVDQRIHYLRSRLNEYGQRAQDEMATVSSAAVDLSEIVEQARNAVSGKPPHEALRAFANVHGVSVKKLRESAIESLSCSPFLASISKVMSSHDGRIIARTPGIKGSTPSDEDEEAIRAEMNRPHYGTLVGVAVQALILPALEVLILEHRLRTADFIELARRSPIVPIGREVLFGKALAEGFNRDFATSIHLLAPQIEHMVRFHLKSAGVPTAHLDQNGIETENGLSALIELPECSTIFGDDLTYEIRALFCDQVGPNLRNNLAHGLLNDREVQSVDAVYAWWLGLKLVFNTFWNSLAKETASEEHEQASEDNPV